MVFTELNNRGVVKRTNTGLPNTYHTMKLRKQSEHPIGQNSLLIYPHFGIEPVQPPRGLNSDDSETVPSFFLFLSTEHRSAFQLSMYLQRKMYPISNHSVDTQIATDICGISTFLLIDSKYFRKFHTLMMTYRSYFYFTHNVINDILPRRRNFI